jgi:hypothetical protein
MGSGGRSKRCEVKCRLDRTTARIPIYVLNEPHGPNPTYRQRKDNEQQRANPVDKESEWTKRANTTSTTLVVTRLREAGPPTSPPDMPMVPASRLSWYTPVYIDTSRYLSTLVLSRYLSKSLSIMPVLYSSCGVGRGAGSVGLTCVPISKKKWFRTARVERAHASNARYAPNVIVQKVLQKVGGMHRILLADAKIHCAQAQERRGKCSNRSRRVNADMQRAQRTANGRNSGHSGTRQAQTEASAHTPD